MPPLIPPKGEETPDRYWRSLADRAGAPEYRRWLEAEFPTAGVPFFESAEAGDVSRRRWLQLAGASLALAAASGCRWEKDELRPFARRPADRVPGRPMHYATSMELAGGALGLVVTTYDGRPVKIEGNPNHPASLGGTHAFAQAAILDLYDPDRGAPIFRREGGRRIPQPDGARFAAFLAELSARLAERRGRGLRILAEPSSSPTLRALTERLLDQYPEAAWHEYAPLARDNELAGARLAFGASLRPVYHFDRARVVVCLDADPLGFHPDCVRHARQFALARQPAPGRMNRLYAVEARLSLSGAAADHRLTLPSGRVGQFAARLWEEVERRTAGMPPGDAAPWLGRGEPIAPELTPEALALLGPMADDLVAHAGRGLVIAGHGQPPEVHALAHAINERLGNHGATITWIAADDRPGCVESLGALVEAMRGGEVETLLILGGNPVYDAPADFAFAAAMEKVPTTVHLSAYDDETSRRATWHVPQAHFLESWGDARAWDGTYGVVQPTIEPLFGGRSAIELLAMLMRVEAFDARGIVRRQFGHIVGAKDDEALWRRTLHDGVLADSAAPAVVPRLAEGVARQSVERIRTAPARSRESASVATTGRNSESPLDRTTAPPEIELEFVPDSKLHDGRWANNAWLQELPDPLTKLTWDNALLLGPATAAALGVQHETLVRVVAGGRELILPAYVMPGQADDTAAVALGYGRAAAGAVGGDPAEGVDPVGADAYWLRTSAAMWRVAGARIEPTGNHDPLATTQDHFALGVYGDADVARRVPLLVREADLDHFVEHPEFARHAVHHPPLKSPWKDVEFGPHRWAMAIDLSRCIGCGTCVVACQAENNIPVVGKPRVLQGREMHWLRIDRYFRGDPSRPQVVFQPVTCHHCETAPCEQVCPVAATVHSSEGLNDMVYNRCVGTRYCANNCPYKVRRFNYFNYQKRFNDPANESLKMAHNPEVTVRCRGVMEKCTFCVQRIQAARIAARAEGRAIADGEIRTACQQACPAGAIVFGDLANPDGEIARSARSARAYHMLAELNLRPRLSYLAKIRNPGAGHAPAPTAKPLDDAEQRADPGTAPNV